VNTSNNPLGSTAVREAIVLLREYGVTPEQYAAADLGEIWIVDGHEHPGREAAFTAAQQLADQTADLAEVWCRRPSVGDSESWVVRPTPTRPMQPIAMGGTVGVVLAADEPATVQASGVAYVAVQGPVVAGALLYLAQPGTSALSTDRTGRLFGYALEPVTAGVSATIPVKIG
jgi:hypothetical protein